jgi:hypothetical protein
MHCPDRGSALKKYLIQFHRMHKKGHTYRLKEKIGNMAQAMEDYKSHITELMELLNPSTPPEVRSQRD